MVGDGHAMSVTAQIAEHILWASEGSFRVDYPVLSEQWPAPCGKGFRLSEEPQVSVKAESAVLESALECGDELAAKDAAEYLDGEKEVVRGLIQRVRSAERPPAGTTQCTWG